MTSPPRARAGDCGHQAITQARARQLASLTYDTATDWHQRGWMTPAEWEGYQAAYRRGVDGAAAVPRAWGPAPPEVDEIALAIGAAIGVRKGRLFDERGMDDPAPWADYGAGSLTKQELLELRRRLRDGHNRRLYAAGGDTSDGTARELDGLFDEVLVERADWLRPHAAAVAEAAKAACCLAGNRAPGSMPAVPAAAAGRGGGLAGDSPYRAAAAAIESFGRTAVRHEQAVAALEAELTVHGLDRDLVLMTAVRGVQEAAALSREQAAAAFKALQSRHATGQEYHTGGQDAAASAFRPVS